MNSTFQGTSGKNEIRNHNFAIPMSPVASTLRPNSDISSTVMIGRPNFNNNANKMSSGLFISGNNSSNFRGDRKSGYDNFGDSLAVINKDLIDESA